MVKNLPATQEAGVLSLGWDDPLEKGSHSSTLAWRFPWTEEPGELQSMRLQRVRHDSHTHTYVFFESSFFFLCKSEIDIVYLVKSEQLP